MSDPVGELKRELLAAAERRQGQAALGMRDEIPRRWLERSHVKGGAVASSRSLPLCSSSSWAPPLRSAAFAPSSSTGASSACLPWERRRALRRAESSRSSTGSDPELPGRAWETDGRSRNWVYADGRLISGPVSRAASSSNASPPRASSSCDRRSSRPDCSATSRPRPRLGRLVRTASARARSSRRPRSAASPRSRCLPLASRSKLPSESRLRCAMSAVFPASIGRAICTASRNGSRIRRRGCRPARG